jgi:pimeloyl-ACP methyl ester carboxylesterase
MNTYGATAVTTVGHSLGAAIALLDALYLPPRLPANTTFATYAYGLPRVGNAVFAAFVDSAASRVNLTHVNNEKDIGARRRLPTAAAAQADDVCPVPTLPPRFVGFVHAAGEVHIQAPGQWYACPGEDNTSAECELGAVPTIFAGNGSNHDGPYGPVLMGGDAGCIG